MHHNKPADYSKKITKTGYNAVRQKAYRLTEKEYDVSIIIPVFNAEKTLMRALKSAIKQTASREIIAIDDASSDKTPAILDRFEKKYDFIKILRNQERQGAGISRNRGIENASGKYVFFLDGDDVLPDKNSLKTMCEVSDKFGTEICGSLRQTVYGWKIKNEKNFKKLLEEHPEGAMMEYVEFQNDYDYTNYIFKRKFLIDNDLKFPRYSRFQDPPFFVRSMILAQKFSVAPVIGYRYYYNDKTFSDESINDIVRGVTDVLELASENNYEKLTEKAVSHLNIQYRKMIQESYQRGNDTLVDLLKIADGKINRELPGCSELHIIIPE
jgi:glycosyltransferase involved in cell wall biosynthesis